MSRQHSLRLARRAGLPGGWRAWLLSALLLFSGIALSACGGGGGSGATASSDTGTVAIGLTDADGDFLSYSVDVTALTRAVGARGSWDSNTATVTSRFAVVKLQ